jgi:YesN/AraC family two-component response regulator
VRKLFLSHGFDYLVKPIADSDLVDLLSRLAGRIEYTAPDVEKKTPSIKFNEILHYLNEYSAMNHTLDTVASRFGIVPGTVCNMFAKHLNTTFSTYLNALRMEHAEKLLRTTAKPVKEIAVSCGYSDALYFTRVFHKKHGIAPTRYRESEYGKK